MHPRPRFLRPAILAIVATVLVAVGPATVAPSVGAASKPVPAPPAIAPTPPLGWNSWNTFRCLIDEKLIRQSADAMVSSGMRAAGYRYVVIDDCWFNPVRAANGSLRANPFTFSHGIPALAAYVHARGLKLGIYESPGPKTCAQTGGTYPGSTGSLGHEAQDARTFASWGIDYLKYDLCTKWDLPQQIAAFKKMGAALKATGRPIVYSINSNSLSPTRTGDTYDWSHIANQWRISDDIEPIWDTSGNRALLGWGVLDIIGLDQPLSARAGPGHWNDADMLVADVSILDGKIRLSPEQARSHVSMWAMLASPLLAGNDLRTMPVGTRDLLTNRDLLAINQDRLGKQAVLRVGDASHQVWSKPLANGDTAVAVLNRQGAPLTVSTTLAEAGIAAPSSPLEVHDIWGARNFVTTSSIVATLPPYGIFLLRVGHHAAGARLVPITDSSSSGSSTVLWVAVGLLAMAGAAGFVALRRSGAR